MFGPNNNFNNNPLNMNQMSMNPINMNQMNPINMNPINPINMNPMNPINMNPINPINMNPINPINMNPINPINMNPINPINMNPINPINMNPINPNVNINQPNDMLTRLSQEYNMCVQDNDLIQIGCNFGLIDNDIYKWRITMVGPKGTPYERGLFTINAIFPNDYPTHGPEFKFINKIYHLNVDFKNEIGHICINSINEWRTRGRVKDLPFYTVKQALFDIFCLFYNQGVDSAYDQGMANQYINNREAFNATARQWTEQYAKM